MSCSNKILKVGVCVLVMMNLVSSAQAFSVPMRTRLVTDPANALSAQVRKDLQIDLQTYQQQTGNEIDVLIVPSLDGGSIEQLNSAVIRSWGLEENHRTVLFAIALKEHKMRISVGSELTDQLTDAEVSQIETDIARPDFQKNAYNEGVLAVVRSIKAEIPSGTSLAVQNVNKNEKNVSSSQAKSFPFWLRLGVFLVLASLVFYVMIRFVMGVKKEDLKIKQIKVLVYSFIALYMIALFCWLIGIWQPAITACMFGAVLRTVIIKKRENPLA